MELLVLWIKRALAATAWGMTPPAPYGAFHLIFFLCGLGLCVLAAWRLRNISERGNRRLLIGIGIFLAVCELYKQLFYLFYIGPKNSPLIVFSTIAEHFGWYVSTLLYIPAVCFGAFMVFLLFRRLTRKTEGRLPQKPASKELIFR